MKTEEAIKLYVANELREQNKLAITATQHDIGRVAGKYLACLHIIKHINCYSQEVFEKDFTAHLRTRESPTRSNNTCFKTYYDKLEQFDTFLGA